MHKKVIFDASALIALFAKEKGWENIKKYLPKSIISTVNLAEVYKYCMETQNLTKTECVSIIKISSITIYNYTDRHALLTSDIAKKSKKYGLSLADRACIALSLDTGYPIITCDRIWDRLDVNTEVILAR